MVLWALTVLASTGWPLFDPANRLDAVLFGWARRMNTVESLWLTDVKRTDKQANGTSVNWKGEVRYLKPDRIALRLVPDDNDRGYELLVLNREKLYEFRPQFNKLVVRHLPLARSNVLDVTLRSMLTGYPCLWPFGPQQKAYASLADGLADMKRLGEIRISRDTGPGNPHYIYLEFDPRIRERRRSYAKAQVVLTKDFLLRRLWMQRPNHSEVLWDFPSIDVETRLKPDDFMPPKAPAGWETLELSIPLLTGHGRRDASSTRPDDK